MGTTDWRQCRHNSAFIELTLSGLSNDARLRKGSRVFLWGTCVPFVVCVANRPKYVVFGRVARKMDLYCAFIVVRIEQAAKSASHPYPLKVRQERTTQ